MPDVSVVQSTSANGTATPAAASLTGVGVGNTILAIIAVIGTSPTISTPAGFTAIVNNAQGTLSFAMYRQFNSAGGSINSSSVLGGTVTGWVIILIELSQMGPNVGIQGLGQHSSGVTQLTNLFPTSGQTLSNELFIYAVARATATLTAQNSSNSPLSVWSASIQPQAGVQGLSLDVFWLSTLGQGVGQYPQALGVLSANVASIAIAAWLNTIAAQPQNGDNIGGGAGILVGGNFQGMIGG